MYQSVAMTRRTHSVAITVEIPKDISPDEVITALHNHGGIMSLQPLVTDSRSIHPKDIAIENVSSNEERHFDGANISDLSHYEVDETVTIIPGIGDWGKKYITFPARWSNTPNGCKGWADAPQDVTVASEWTVKPKDGEGESWELEEKATVECSVLLMPFVRRSFERTQREMAHRIVESVRTAGGGEAQQSHVGQ